MNNFRETKEEKDCTRCKHFCSWRSFMGDDDPYEPDELGKCENELNEDGKGEELGCGELDGFYINTELEPIESTTNNG